MIIRSFLTIVGIAIAAVATVLLTAWLIVTFGD